MEGRIINYKNLKYSYKENFIGHHISSMQKIFKVWRVAVSDTH